MLNHLHGDSERLFLNLELGCASSCSYCYLPVEGIPTGSRLPMSGRVSASRILASLEGDKRIQRGVSGTIFSIGCFSECWDARNLRETVFLVCGLLPFGNRIQLATKRQIKVSELSPIVQSKDWGMQLHIHISSATIKFWREYEKGTTAPAKRFASFSACNSVGIPTSLYIKPVIPGVTIQDADEYGAIMREYGVSAIVGDRFQERTDGRSQTVFRQLEIARHADVERMTTILSRFGNVHRNSIDALGA